MPARIMQPVIDLAGERNPGHVEKAASCLLVPTLLTDTVCLQLLRRFFQSFPFFAFAQNFIYGFFHKLAISLQICTDSRFLQHFSYKAFNF
jgi:hypothetical protein